MTKRELAELIGVSPAAVGQYESGTRPRPELLSSIARHLNYPIEFFMLGRHHAKLDASAAHFRSLRATRSFQRAKAVSFTEQVWELAFSLEKRVQLPWVGLPGFSGGEVTPGVDLPEDPKQAAAALRQHWGLGQGPIPHLLRLLEVRGIIVALAPPDGDFTTVSAFSTSRLPRPIVIVSRDRSADVYRHRFTVAHELGHLVLHGDVHPGDQKQEREADVFAAEFLTPESSILPDLPDRLNFDALANLQSTWGVSMSSLIYRCREVGHFAESTTTRAYKRLHAVQQNGAFAPEPITGYPGEQPTLLKSAFELACKHGLSLHILAAELAWPPERVSALLDVSDQRPKLKLIRGGSP